MEYNIITIEREFASGGREIGKKVAKELAIPYYGKEILEMAAERYGTSAEYLEHLEESATNSLLYSIYMMAQGSRGQIPTMSVNDELNLAEGKIIKEISLKGPAVIIGRCASNVLRERNDVLNVFIHSALDLRKKRAIEDYNIEEAKVESILKKFDKRRSDYYKANTGTGWSDSSNYHLVLDSGKLGIDTCVQVLVDIMKKAEVQPR